jgi:hypothetical protein
MTIGDSLIIPVDLYYEIQQFLNSYEYWSLITVSKCIFVDVGYSTRKIQLSTEESSLFLKDPIFARLILSKIRNPLRQLILDIENNAVTGCFLASKIIAKGALRECNFPVFQIMQNLHLSKDSETMKLPFLPNLQSLTVNYYSRLSYLSTLSHLKQLYLFECEDIRDVSCLQNLDELSLLFCPNIEDVSTLGNIRKLWLEGCYGVKDISKLSNNYSLKIDCSMTRTSVTTLPSKIHSTVLSMNSSLIADKTPEYFPQLKKVKICWSEIKSLTFLPLENLLSLSIWAILSLTSLSPGVKRIPVVIIVKCYNLEDISDLGENKSVRLYLCNKVKSFRSLKNVPKVEIEACDSFRDGHDVGNVRHLIIRECNNFQEDVSMLTKVQHLELYPWNGTVKGLFKIPVLEFSLHPLTRLLEPVEFQNAVIKIAVSSLPPESLSWIRERYDICESLNRIVLLKRKVSGCVNFSMIPFRPYFDTLCFSCY